jgi:hypothetical protein
MGDQYAAQTVCVGFHSSPGEGAYAVMTGYYEHKLATDLHKTFTDNVFMVSGEASGLY